ncbi:RNA-binding RNA processing protein rpp1 [Exophiala xenobiotica]|nr:RNA-binding RNA processing protein rpp1 [Exophiala xenobiotica]KAK5213411.1 RNA-binding RNA processing protein rpp1 [Exophiala xenobiotica]KAK5237978.1 RNA-binding RNA processing protein rpp1 [Exophiala xenobiotica]KAK5254987.1 RNA-binding RNA processing protein rpp1 [Exophiala xenobiotica]KAK5355731.1 RNA-binding RNA processing protein rpp1 [Exophiala xenobiotica]
MPFHDLNIPYSSSQPSSALSHTLLFASELGYTTVALSLTFAGKLPSTPPPIPVSTLSIPQSLTILTRLTITISDASQNHRLSSFSPAYNLLALRPTTEKALQLCCTSLECDLISLDFTQRLTYPIKFTTVAGALNRGVRFEICYAPGISSSTSDDRRNLIAGATSLIRATRGRGIIFSSEARNALGLRGPHDVINLAQVWGLGQERGKEALCEEAGKVVKLAGMKRTSFRGVVEVIDGGGTSTSTSATVRPTNAGGAEGRKQQATTKPAVTTQRDERGKGNEVVPSNGTKRKASVSSLGGGVSTTHDESEDKPLSKREMKRRAKKARMEGKAAGPDDTHPTDGAQDTTATSEFPIKHEALADSSNKVPKKKS